MRGLLEKLYKMTLKGLKKGPEAIDKAKLQRADLEDFEKLVEELMQPEDLAEVIVSIFRQNSKADLQNL